MTRGARVGLVVAAVAVVAWAVLRQRRAPAMSFLDPSSPDPLPATRALPASWLAQDDPLADRYYELLERRRALERAGDRAGAEAAYRASVAVRDERLRLTQARFGT